MIDRFYRVDGYSSDGFFLIKTELENAYLRRQKADESKPMLQAIVNRALNNSQKELFLSPGTTFIDGSDLKVYKLIGDKNEVYIDAKFLRYFGSLKGLTFSQDFENGEWFKNSQVVIRRNGEFIGVIMPIRQG